MILVTGATGFLGAELVHQLLQEGEKIRALKRGSSTIPDILKNVEGIEWKDADLLDYSSLQPHFEGVNRVYHCAAMVSFQPSDRKQMLQVNIEGTANLVNLSLENGISKFLHVSSVAAVGDEPRGGEITEKHRWEWSKDQSAYSISKFESEMQVFRAHAEGLPVVVVNPGIIIGRNCGTRGSGELIQAVRNGLKFYPGGSFGYVDVQDVAAIMIKLMDSPIEGERFILNAENRTYKEFFDEVALRLNVPPPAIVLEPWMLHLAYVGSRILSVFTGKRYRLSPDTVRSAFRKRRYSNEKIRKALNFEFKPLQQSIAESCNI